MCKNKKSEMLFFIFMHTPMQMKYGIDMAQQVGKKEPFLLDCTEVYMEINFCYTVSSNGYSQSASLMRLKNQKFKGMENVLPLHIPELYQTVHYARQLFF